jgi:hypothetical protein
MKDTPWNGRMDSTQALASFSNASEIGKPKALRNGISICLELAIDMYIKGILVSICNGRIEIGIPVIGGTNSTGSTAINTNSYKSVRKFLE